MKTAKQSAKKIAVKSEDKAIKRSENKSDSKMGTKPPMGKKGGKGK